MSQTISASMKVASPATRSEWESVFEATATPSPAKDSDLEVHDCCAAVAKYDPVVNYLLPRPRFLRYDPNLRVEVLRRMQSFEESLDSEMESSSSETGDSSSSSMEGLNFLSCRLEELSDDQTPLHQEGAIGLIGMVGVGEPTAQQVAVEGLELEEGDDDDVDEEKIRWSWWHPSLVLESLLVLGLLLILAPLYFSCVCSTSGVTFGEGGLGGGLLEIHDPMPHPSRFSFANLIASPFSDFGVTSSRDIVDINSSVDVMNGNVYKFATPNPGLEEMVVSNTSLEEENLVVTSYPSQIGLMDMEEESLATPQTVVENVHELHDIMEADEKQYSEVEEMANGIEVVPFSEKLEQFEMVLPSFMHGSIESIVDQQPLSDKLSLNGIVSLSMEPTCNTYGITSSYGASLRLEENGNHLFPPNARNCYLFEEPTSEEVRVEGLELEEEVDDEEEERSCWRPSSVLESLLVLSLVIFAPFHVSYVCSTSGVTFGDGGVGGGLLEIHDPLPHPSRFSFEKLIGNNQFSSPFFGVGVTSSSRFVNSSTDMVDGDSYMFGAPNLGLAEMDASFYLKDAAYGANTLLEEANFLVKSDLSLIGLLDMEERLATEKTIVENVEELPDIMQADEKQYSEVQEITTGIGSYDQERLATQQTVLENVEGLPDIMEADEKQYSGVQEIITGVGSYDEASKIEVPFFEGPRQFEMVLPSVMQGSIDSIDDQERWLTTQQTVLENVQELPDIMEADDEKQYSEVQEIITGVGSYDEASKIEVSFFEEPRQFEMVLPSVMQGSIDSIDERPLSEKLSISDIVSLSMEPMCNTYGITSYYGTSLRLEENGNHLFPPNSRNYSFLPSVPTAVLVLAAILSSFVCLKCMKVRNSSTSTANASTIGRVTSKTQTPKYEVSSSTLSSTRRRLSMASSTNQERRLSSSLSTADSTSYGSITIHKEVVLKQEVVSTPVRRSSRLLNRTPPPYLL